MAISSADSDGCSRVIINSQQLQVDDYLYIGSEEDGEYEGEFSGNPDEQDDDNDMVVDDVPSVAPANGGETKRCHFMTLSDPDVLDSPICLDPLTVPVFQCENGHIACSSCSTKVKKCPLCTLPIGYIRCRGIGKVIKSVKAKCSYFGRKMGNLLFSTIKSFSPLEFYNYYLYTAVYIQSEDSASCVSIGICFCGDFQIRC